MNHFFLKVLLGCVFCCFFNINANFAQSPADVAGATILCNKDKLTIGQMEGCGDNCRELTGNCLDDGSNNPIETNSIWFNWKAANDGDLTFVIEALNPNDRLSFALVELPNGFNDGTGMVTFRCIAACNFNPIGLNSTDFDVAIKQSDCASAENGFLEALHMQEGLTYGLLVNNPNSTGGFTIEFGGDGTFEGPQAVLTPDQSDVCFGQTVTFQNNSSFGQGNITGFEWNFGNDVVGDAIRTTATVDEALTVEYQTPGPKTVELIITTNLGCKAKTTFTDIVTIQDCCESDNKVDIADNPTIMEIACPGDTNGSIDIEVTSVFPVSYEWSNGATTEDISNLPPGTYSVTVTSEATCKDSLSYEFIVPSTLSATDAVQVPSCGGIKDGVITITATGGRAPYQYDFGDGNGFVNSNSLNGLDTGDYTVIVQDASGCTFPVEAIELDANTLEVTIESTKDPSCHNGMDGVVTVSIERGIGPYTYDFNDGNNPLPETALSSLAAGTYIVDVFDAEQCHGLLEFSLKEPEELRLNIEPGRITCNGADDGASVAVPSGGTPGYTYAWSNGATTKSINNLSPGDYTLTVTDAQGCTVESGTIITEPNTLTATITNTQDIDCPGSANGSVEFMVDGGTSPYQYSLDGNTFLDGTLIENLAEGDYSIIIKDNNDCRTTLTATINDPSSLAIGISATSNICYGESISIMDASSFSRGNITNWEWNFGTGASPQTSTGPGPHNVTFNKIGNPIISLVIRTDLGCEVTLTDTLNIEVEACCDTKNGVSLLAFGEEPSCFEATDGGIDLSITSDPNIASINWDNNATTEDLDQIAAGDYTVTVTNEATCEATTTVSLGQPSQINLSLEITKPTCSVASNGFIIATATGGTGNLGTYEFDFNRGDGFSTKDSLAGLTTGIYQVIARDENQCLTAMEADLTVAGNIQPVKASLDLTSPSCDVAANGAVQVIPDPGTGPYEYDFGNGYTNNNRVENLAIGNISVSIRDEDNCVLEIDTVLAVDPNAEPIDFSLNIINPNCGGASDGSITVVTMNRGSGSGVGTNSFEYDFGNGFTTNNVANNLPIGDYSITVRDEYNCTAMADTSLNELVLMPDAPAIAMPTCFGFSDGQIAFNVPNGVGPFLYDFNDGMGFQEATSLNNLPRGNYMIRIQDADLCLSETISIMIDEPSALAINSNVTNVSCFGEGDGRIITTLSGGTGNYTYNWNNGATGHRIENLVPGTYSVEVLDANNCSITDTNAITEPDELSVGVSSVSNVLCFGESNGMINVAAMGGNMPFSYSLDGVIFQSSPTIENLAAGEYTVTVRDDRGCEVMSNTATVDQPAEFAVIAETDRTVANLGFTVNLSATATGNNSGVNFVWSTPDSVVCTNCPTFETTPPGSTTYTVTAVNSDNCTATASIKIAVSLDRPVYIPNAFSPNGDGQNDEFFIPFSPAMSSIKELRIFDRTGNLVYEAFDIMRGEEFSRAWDGEFNGSKLRYGVFVISAQIHFVDGQTLPYQSDLTLFGEE